MFEHWMVNLIHGQLEVYREPVPDSQAEFGWLCRQGTFLQPEALVAPLALPDSRIRVADLLP